MSMSGGGKKRGGALNEINVTPLVDVMLVLLIVFMVTTPVMVEGIKRHIDVDLPQTNAETVKSIEDLETLILVKADKTIMLDLGETPTPLWEECKTGKYPECLNGLEARVKAIPTLADFRDGKRLFFVADRQLPYGYVLDAMARLKNAGITNLGMVTNPPEGEGDAAP